MNKSYLINHVVIFHSEEHRLVPVKGHNGVETSLNIPASRCLLLLIERKNTVVSKEDLFDKAWEQRGTYVTANTFYQNISLLRKALKSVGLPEEIIKTVPKRGLMLDEDVVITPFTQEVGPKNSVIIEQPRETEQVSTLSTPLSTSESEELAPTDRKSDHTHNSWRGVVISTLVFFAIALTFTLLIKEPKKFLDGYKKSDDVNGCSLYVPDKERDVAKYVNFINNNKIACNANNSILFMTIDKTSEYTSIIRCDSTQITQDSYCDSKFYSRGKK